MDDAVAMGRARLPRPVRQPRETAAAEPVGHAGPRGATGTAPGASAPIAITFSASVKLLGITIANALLWDEHTLARTRAAGGYYAALGQSKAEFVAARADQRRYR